MNRSRTVLANRSKCERSISKKLSNGSAILSFAIVIPMHWVSAISVPGGNVDSVSTKKKSF